MVRNALLFLAGLVSMAFLLIEWPLVVPVVHVLLGR